MLRAVTFVKRQERSGAADLLLSSEATTNQFPIQFTVEISKWNGNRYCLPNALVTFLVVISRGCFALEARAILLNFLTKFIFSFYCKHLLARGHVCWVQCCVFTSWTIAEKSLLLTLTNTSVPFHQIRCITFKLLVNIV